MAGAFLYVFLNLMLSIPVLEGMPRTQADMCITEKPCFDLILLAKMEEHVSKNVIDADGENILLNHGSFDKIRKKRNHHSCVLRKIITLFQDVLIRTEGRSALHATENINYHRELIDIMEHLKTCIHKVKDNCANLYNNAFKTSTAASPTTTSERDMTPKQLVALQLQKLKNAQERVTDVEVQDRVLDELKALHSYMPGRGFRKVERTKEKHRVS
ncbi:hypothetical protein DNTS_009806 [Danionella cerebrum]|uniref:Interleukin-6 n=1 Tax=Danionella cerebrum TaxID=2873325 RepID=A0A553MY67_9TELE|nr:hypothetical protein DNTS_009806 [Danionella translucida]